MSAKTKPAESVAKQLLAAGCPQNLPGSGTAFTAGAAAHGQKPAVCSLQFAAGRAMSGSELWPVGVMANAANELRKFQC